MTAATGGAAARLLRARHVLEYAAIRMLAGLLGLLGPDRASAVSGRVWRRIAPHTRRHARALANLAVAFPEKSAGEHEAIARASWENLGRTMAEGMLAARIVGDASRIRIGTADVWDVVRAAGGRVVIAGLHYGNWEVACWPLTAAGFRTAGVYQRVHNPLIDAYIVRQRATVFPGGMHGKGHGTPRRLLSWVKAGNPVGILADHRELRGVTVDFFGRPAPSNPLPAMMARALDVPLIAGRSVREGASVRFRIDGEVVAVPRTGDRAADIAAATAALQQVFERWIREDPTQWMWGHRRWARERRAPPSHPAAPGGAG